MCMSVHLNLFHKQTQYYEVSKRSYDCTCLCKTVILWKFKREATGVYIGVKSVPWELTQYLQSLSLLALRGVSKPNTPTGSRRLMSSGREREGEMERGRQKCLTVPLNQV